MSVIRRPPPPRPRTTIASVVLLLVLCATVVHLLGAGRAADAEPGPPSCSDIAARYAGQLPAGWALDCATSLPDGWPAPTDARPHAMSDRHQRRIVVVEGQAAGMTEAAIAHEIAHAEATGWPSSLRVAVAQAMGERSWSGAGGPTSPAEVFAESSVRCRGLPTQATFPLVPCDLVEAARAAGGATTALPVTGTLPTS